MRSLVRQGVAALLAAALVVTAMAAEEEVDRPRIGLVLSGGGALGMAHVGVIKVLEELRVPIDCVAGTSMGAIVGGLYASGVSTAEMEELLAEIDWASMFDDRPPRRLIPFRRKQDDLHYQTRFEVGINREGFKLPSALVSGQKLGIALQTLTMHTVGVESFDELPIPFRAVATDIETGEAVVLGDGDLGHAIRASMAIPGVIAPFEIDGRLLVDGALAANLPVHAALEMGAEVIIAVNLDEGLASREELGNMVQVLGQVMDLLSHGNVQQQLESVHVLIKPDLEGFGASSFEKGPEIVPRGEEAARAVAVQLGAFALSDEQYRAYLESRVPLEMAPEVLTSVQVALSSTADPQVVLRRIRVRSGDPLDAEAIRRDLERLYMLGDYERVGFRLVPNDDGYGLIIEVHYKSWGPHVMRLGTDLGADLEGDSAFRLRVNYTMTGLNRTRGEAKFAIDVGEDPRAFAEFYQPLSLDGPLFVSPWVEHIKSRVRRSDDGLYFAEYKLTRFGGGLDLGLSLGRFGEVRLGVVGGRSRAVPSQGGDELETVETDWGGVSLRTIIDQLDDPNIPRSGYTGELELYVARDGLGAEDEYERLSVSGLGALELGRSSVSALVEVGTGLGSEVPFYDQFQLGGLFRLSGLPFDSISGTYGALGALFYNFEIWQLPSGGGVFAGASVEAGNLWPTRNEVDLGDLRYAGSLYLAADTFVGPVHLAYGHADGGESAFYLFVGRWF